MLHGRVTSLAGALALALLAPAAASAATTYTVDPSAAAGCDGAHVCKAISDANARVADGDTVSIKAGTYSEAPITVVKSNVSFVAADPGRVTVSTSSSTAQASTFTLGDGNGGGQGTVLRGLVVGVPPSGGAAVVVKATGTLVDATTLQRLGATADVPVYAVDDTGSGVTAGTNTLQNAFVIQFATPSAAGTAPAVLGGGRTSLALEGAFIVSGDKSGPGVRLVGNESGKANSIARGAIYAANPAANAVEVSSAADSARAKATALDSVILSPGVNGAGVRASSANAMQGSTAGNVTVAAHRVTVAGGGRPFALDAQAQSAPAANPTAVGTVAVDVDHAIAHGAGASTVAASADVAPPATLPGVPALGQKGSSAKLTIADSDTTDASSGSGAATTTVSGGSNSSDASLFRNLAARDLHLRASAPVIDKGGAAAAGESPLDFEAQPRTTGAAIDLGADEYLNTPPTASLKADRTTAKTGETVSFDASGSSDPDGESGSGITQYAFDFGDGSPGQFGTSPTATHQYAKPGSYTATVGVVDAGGAAAFAQAPLAVGDANAPTVTITSPTAQQRLKLFSVKVLRKALAKKAGRKRTRVTTRTKLRKVQVTGTASDPSGVKFLELSVRRVTTARSKAKVGTTVKTVTAKASARAATAATCTFLDQNARRFVTRACDKPVYFAVRFRDGKFAYQLGKSVPFRLGTYTVSARGTNANQNVSAPVTTAFTLR